MVRVAHVSHNISSRAEAAHLSFPYAGRQQHAPSEPTFQVQVCSSSSGKRRKTEQRQGYCDVGLMNDDDQIN